MAKIVFVAMRGRYTNRDVEGIYESAEQAMASLPGNKWTMTVWTFYRHYPDVSKEQHWVSWGNDLDWDDACTITMMEMSDTPTRREPDSVVIQTLAKDGGWDYVPTTVAEALKLVT